MDQETRWMLRYNEVKTFIETNHRNPSKHRLEERNLVNYLRHTRKQMNHGLLKPERIEAFNKLLALSEKYRHVNQWK